MTASSGGARIRFEHLGNVRFIEQVYSDATLSASANRSLSTFTSPRCMRSAGVQKCPDKGFELEILGGARKKKRGRCSWKAGFRARLLYSSL